MAWHKNPPTKETHQEQHLGGIQGKNQEQHHAENKNLHDRVLMQQDYIFMQLVQKSSKNPEVLMLSVMLSFLVSNGNIFSLVRDN